jgi:pyridoxine/pyridoxamine 5'-phosphate oxidase
MVLPKCKSFRIDHEHTWRLLRLLFESIELWARGRKRIHPGIKQDSLRNGYTLIFLRGLGG